MVRVSAARTWRYRRERYRLIASVCRKCGTIYYPPRPVCPKCRSQDMEERELSGKGKVMTYTVLHTVPEGFRGQAPLLLAVIQLDEGVRVLGQLTDVKPEEVTIGMPVEAVLRRITEDGSAGIIRYGVKFRPVLRGASTP